MKRKANTADIILHIIIIIISVSCIVPIVNTIAVSMSDKSSAATGKVFFWPVGFNMTAYKEILNDARFFSSFGVSVIRVLLGTGLNTVLSILMAYPLSKDKQVFPARTVYVWIMVFTMLFNGGLVPTFLLVKNIGIIDTIWALVLPGAVNVFNTIILMNFFKGIPKSLEEAAYVDGAQPFYVLFCIFVPLGKYPLNCR